MSANDNEFEDADRPTEAAQDPAESALAASESVRTGDGADHYGQDGGRDTLTAGEAQSAMSGSSEQDSPAMAQNNAPDADKIAGIVAQTRQDAEGQSREWIVEVLTQRLRQAGVDLAAVDVDTLTEQVRTDLA